ncbi:LytR/AlgR family response regulator transcription factor [Clostridium hydrogeniformans]|uniref:LytR/AlgR family response regulator transcription factor n=1 Tax=Clostridium hydrogeniformans TaxID=349933 RepID=UPI000481DC94|nr:LytTR family DNA-binding domain-containing protein [Clostridium hydrogeniformans]
MNNIILLEDSKTQRKFIEDTLKELIIENNFDDDFNLELSTEDVEDIENYLSIHPNSKSIYVIDINIKSEKLGFYLGEKIRHMDPFGTLIFLTGHSEIMNYVFLYNLEVMDFIVKGIEMDVKNRLKKCLFSVKRKLSTYYNTLPSKSLLNICTKERILSLEMKDILYIESIENTHKIIIHTPYEEYEVYDSLKNLSLKLDEKFFRCHRSFVVNIDHVSKINIKNFTAEINNKYLCLVSVRKLKELVSLYDKARFSGN